MDEALLEVRKLKKYFPVKGGLFQRRVGYVRAVDGVDLAIRPGQSFGLVGESGSGKTTVGKTILRLIEPTEGEIIFEGQDLCQLAEAEMRKRREDMQMIFQDPYSSLNPRMTVKRIVGEPLVVHKLAKGRALDDRVRELTSLVGLMEDHLYRYPHEFSGGQRQRIGVARALALEPKMLILDEPTSALDVSVQAQVLDLLLDLQQRLNLTYLFISHDLAVIRYICDHVALMYMGKILEQAPVEEIFERPMHPYTQALLSAMPVADPEFQPEEIILEGEISTMGGEEGTCRFGPRCPARDSARCRDEEPVLKELEDGHLVACHLYG
ncbi:MAG: ATP-binding cassette domain-containing protein [Anaerolineae bacterium]|nr:ATP-binding cassette domain-containing protein [Anaerolineae bacterium]NIN96744.1 ATP-binding cassette domain-containing protein [Anaerolineae bacterium]NIQ79740.1 ATP-binding cassette domain-containing protein [Anaerolineae bacterium]